MFLSGRPFVVITTLSTGLVGVEVENKGKLILTGHIPLGRLRRRWEDNIRIDLKEIDINRIDLAQDRDYLRTHVNAAFNFRIP